MKKTNIAIAVSCAAMLASYPAMANPTFSGEMGLGALKVDGRDLDTWAYDMTAGFSGSQKMDGLSVNYQFVADFTGEVNDLDPLVYTRSGGNNRVYVRDARFAVPTKYGTFVVAPRSTSGQFAHLYGNVSEFDYNELHSQTGVNAMFTQGRVTNNLLGYATPRFAGWQVILGSFTFRKDNDQDVDAYSYRALYTNGGFYFAVGQVFISDQQAASGEKEERNAATIAYSWDSLKLSATIEQNDVPDDAVNDFTTWAARADYRLNDRWSTAIAYADKSHGLSELDNTAVIAQVKRQLNSQTYLFVETGQYDNTPSNYSIGLNVKF